MALGPLIGNTAPMRTSSASAAAPMSVAADNIAAKIVFLNKVPSLGRSGVRRYFTIRKAERVSASIAWERLVDRRRRTGSMQQITVAVHCPAHTLKARAVKACGLR